MQNSVDEQCSGGLGVVRLPRGVIAANRARSAIGGDSCDDDDHHHDADDHDTGFDIILWYFPLSLHYSANEDLIMKVSW